MERDGNGGNGNKKMVKSGIKNPLKKVGFSLHYDMHPVFVFIGNKYLFKPNYGVVFICFTILYCSITRHILLLLS